MKNSKEIKSERNHFPFSIFHFQLAVAALGVAIYLVFFFATTFEPYANFGAEISRGSFFALLLFPDEYFAHWLGPDGVFSLARPGKAGA